MEAPPLPEPEVTAISDYFDASGARQSLAFTADQLRERDAYWLAKVEEAVKAERERCAKLCELESSDPDSLNVSEYDDNHMQGWHDGCESCATSIREGG